MRTLIMFIFLFAATFIYGQSFVNPVGSSLGSVKSIMVKLKDGSEVRGNKFVKYTTSNGQLTSFTLKNEDGIKEKFKAKDVEAVKIELDEFSKKMMSLNSPTLYSALKKDYAYLDSIDYVIFEQVEVKKGKFKLLQLLNPGLDKYIKVYLDPHANKGVVYYGIIGGEDRSYIVKKDNETFRVKKGNYKKYMEKLYMDNFRMADLIKSKKIRQKFKDFPAHIALYNESRDY